MRVSEFMEDFSIYTSNEEYKLLKRLGDPAHLNSFAEHDQFVIENLVRKGLVVKIGNTNPIVVKNDI